MKPEDKKVGGFSPYILAQMIAPGNIQQPGLYPAGNQAGDLYYGADGIHFNRLGIGHEAQVLTVSQSIPSWQTLPQTALTRIQTITASSSSTIDFTSIANTTYRSYKIIGYNITPSNNAVTLQMRVSVGGTFQSGAGAYEHRQFRFTTAASGISGSDSDTLLNITSAGDTVANTGTGKGIDFELTFFNATQTNTAKRAIWNAHYLGSAFLELTGGGAFLTASVIDGFRFLMSAGTISTGTITLYGFS